MFSQPYVAYIDGSSHSTWNLSSAVWVIYAPSVELVSLQGICIGCSTNNIVEYSTVIELLSNVISSCIYNMVVILESQLVVLHFRNVYSVRSPTMLYMFLKFFLLEINFDYV